MPFKLDKPSEQEQARLRLAITMVEALAEVVAESLGVLPTTPSIIATALVHVAGGIIALGPDAEARGQIVEHLQVYLMKAAKP